MKTVKLRFLQDLNQGDFTIKKGEIIDTKINGHKPLVEAGIAEYVNKKRVVIHDITTHGEKKSTKTKKDVVIGDITTNNNNIVKRGSSSMYYYYNQVKDYLQNHNSLSYTTLQLERWIGFYDKIHYLRIIYLLLKLKTMHLSGISKIIGYGRQKSKQYLETLRHYNIIAIADKRDKTVQKLYGILKKTDGFTDYHWGKAEFYRLTEMAESFFSPLPYKTVLDYSTLQHIEKYRRELMKKHDDIEITFLSEVEAVEEIKEKFEKQIEAGNDSLTISFVKRQMELYSDRGTDFTKSSEEIWDYLLSSKDKGVLS